MVKQLCAKRSSTGLVMESMYKYLGLTRQAHASRLLSMEREALCMELVKEMVMAYRKDKDRRAGSRTLFYNLGIKEKFGIGITKFERLMAQYGLSLTTLRIKVVTTKSVHQSWNYDNLVNGLIINDINRVVVGDLTYIDIGKMRFYAFMLTDIYSARLAGISISTRMLSKDAKIALDQWIALRGKTVVEGCIHHTDGGSQYFSKLYMNELKKWKILTSVARNCLQNGYAEQRNGLLKNHFVPVLQMQEEENLKRQFDQISYFYNYERKQKALGWRTPVEFETYINGLELEQRPKLRLHDFGKGQSKLGFSEA